MLVAGVSSVVWRSSGNRAAGDAGVRTYGGQRQCRPQRHQVRVLSRQRRRRQRARHAASLRDCSPRTVTATRRADSTRRGREGRGSRASARCRGNERGQRVAARERSRGSQRIRTIVGGCARRAGSERAASGTAAGRGRAAATRASNSAACGPLRVRLRHQRRRWRHNQPLPRQCRCVWRGRRRAAVTAPAAGACYRLRHCRLAANVTRCTPTPCGCSTSRCRSAATRRGAAPRARGASRRASLAWRQVDSITVELRIGAIQLVRFPQVGRVQHGGASCCRADAAGIARHAAVCGRHGGDTGGLPVKTRPAQLRVDSPIPRDSACKTSRDSPSSARSSGSRGV